MMAQRSKKQFRSDLEKRSKKDRKIVEILVNPVPVLHVEGIVVPNVVDLRQLPQHQDAQRDARENVKRHKHILALSVVCFAGAVVGH
jgi:hypothetical protein